MKRNASHRTLLNLIQRLDEHHESNISENWGRHFYSKIIETCGEHEHLENTCNISDMMVKKNERCLWVIHRKLHLLYNSRFLFSKKRTFYNSCFQFTRKVYSSILLFPYGQMALYGVNYFDVALEGMLLRWTRRLVLSECC